MTDKTDIAALLGKLKFFAGEASCHPDPNYSLEFERLCTPSNILAVLDQIEVVSKSEWKLAGELVELHMTFNALQQKYETESQRASDLVLHVNTQANIRDKAEKSNAFLKEELAKLANFNPDWDMLEACRESWHEVVALLKEREAELTTLKAKLANPVVLPTGYSARDGHPFHEGERNVMIPNKHGDWLSRFDVEHALRVAGFTVKGE